MDNGWTALGKRIAIITCLGTVAGTPVFADSFCEGMRDLAKDGDVDASLLLPNGALDKEATCRTSFSQGGGRDVNCNWTFEYRSQAALDAFEDVTREVTQCLGPHAIQSSDQQVNHPDAYDLRLFEVDGKNYAVSLKDKGALQQTLIFLRVPLTAKP